MPPGGAGAPAARGRVLAFDLGERRIGVAVSDSDRLLAMPRGVIERSGDRAADRRAMAGAVTEAAAVEVVVGLPLSLDGSVGAAAQAVLDELAELAAVLGVPVHTVDERYTSVQASRLRRSAEAPLAARPVGAVRDASRARRRPAGARRRGRAALDDSAAAIILQSWLDAGGRPPAGSGRH